MSALSILATELLCHIFCISVALAETAETTGSGDDKEFLHFALRRRVRTAVALSQVCQRWRRIAVDLPTLWNRVYLTRAMCARGALDSHQVSHTIFRRSRNSPLHLDIHCPLGKQGPLRASRPLPTSIWASLLRHNVLSRCIALRLNGTHDNLQSVLQVFIDYNSSFKSSSTRFIPLQELEVAQHCSLQQSTSQLFNVASISPNITSLRSSGVIFCNCPQWSMEEITLENIALDRTIYRTLISSAGVKKLILRRVVVPVGLEYVMSPLELARWNDHYGCNARLEHIEFDSIVDPYRNQRHVGPAHENPYIHYASFYVETLIPDCAKTLKTLRMANLSADAWTAFVKVSKNRPEVVFSQVRTLGFCNIPVRNDGKKEIKTLQHVFPDIDRLTLMNMGRGAQPFLGELCVNSGAWSSLRECQCEGRTRFLPPLQAT